MLKNVRQGKYMQKKVSCFQGTGSNFESKELNLGWKQFQVLIWGSGKNALLSHCVHLYKRKVSNIFIWPSPDLSGHNLVQQGRYIYSIIHRLQVAFGFSLSLVAEAAWAESINKNIYFADFIRKLDKRLVSYRWENRATSLVNINGGKIILCHSILEPCISGGAGAAAAWQ